MERTWTPERVGCWYMEGGVGGGGGEGVVGGTGRIPEVVINEFRVFPDWSPLRFDVNTKKGKSHQEWK